MVDEDAIREAVEAGGGKFGLVVHLNGGSETGILFRKHELGKGFRLPTNKLTAEAITEYVSKWKPRDVA